MFLRLNLGEIMVSRLDLVISLLEGMVLGREINELNWRIGSSWFLLLSKSVS